MIRDVLRMGDPRLFERSREVDRTGTSELSALLEDMRDTMRAQNGAGLAAPQIGVGLRVVIFGVERNERYPDAEPVPYTEIVNPVVTALSDELEDGWEGCLSVPGLRGVVPRFRRLRYRGLARELGVEYASVCVVVNHAAGRGDSVASVSMESIANVLETGMDRVRALIERVVPRVPLAPREVEARREAVIMGASGDDS